jgi:hypothetical protein
LDFFFRRALKALGARRRRLSWDLGTDCRIRWGPAVRAYI